MVSRIIFIKIKGKQNRVSTFKSGLSKKCIVNNAFRVIRYDGQEYFAVHLA